MAFPRNIQLFHLAVQFHTVTFTIECQTIGNFHARFHIIDCLFSLNSCTRHIDCAYTDTRTKFTESAVWNGPHPWHAFRTFAQAQLTKNCSRWIRTHYKRLHTRGALVPSDQLAYSPVELQFVHHHSNNMPNIQ